MCVVVEEGKSVGRSRCPLLLLGLPASSMVEVIWHQYDHTHQAPETWRLQNNEFTRDELAIDCDSKSFLYTKCPLKSPKSTGVLRHASSNRAGDICSETRKAGAYIRCANSGQTGRTNEPRGRALLRYRERVNWVRWLSHTAVHIPFDQAQVSAIQVRLGMFRRSTHAAFRARSFFSHWRGRHLARRVNK